MKLCCTEQHVLVSTAASSHRTSCAQNTLVALSSTDLCRGWSAQPVLQLCLFTWCLLFLPQLSEAALVQHT